MSDWIAVKDKLPKDGQQVLVFLKRPEGPVKCAFFGWYYDCNYVVIFSAYDNSFFDDTQFTGTLPVTHWMKLPKEP